MFDELNKQLATATDGKVNIGIKNGSFGFGLARFGLVPEIKNTIPSSELYASNILSKSQEHLAYWNQDRNGYPCKISYGNKEQYCDDKLALEESLAKLLQDPIVGETLYKLMQLPNSKDS